MTIINTLNDIEESNLDFRLKYYLNKRFRVISQSLKTENLVCFGSIFVFEKDFDSNALSDIGIHCPPSEIIFENVTKIHILHSREEFNILLGCVIFFLPTIREWAEAIGVRSAGEFIIFNLAAINIIVELLVNIFLVPVLVRLVNLLENQIGVRT
jgi:hypothetical protein